MTNYSLYQDSAKGKQKITEINEKGIKLTVESNGGTSSSIKIDGKEIAKGVIPYVKGFVEGLHCAVCKA